MSAIIVLTIGPVQSYISQARRTQDLWQGSRILSYLASAGVHYAMNQQQAEVIYPSIKSDQTDNIPNRMVVKWSGDDAGARSCAEQMEHAIRGAWQTLSANTLRYFIEGIESDASENVMRIWQAQEESWLECYWVVTPYDEGKHAESINTANAMMGARKLFRNFPQVHEEGRKCSITGEHESLRGTSDYVTFWNGYRANQRNLSLLGRHERLSAISTIKRFAHEERQANDPINPPLRIEHRFPSTGSVAAAPFKYHVLRALHDEKQDSEKLRDTLQKFIGSLLACYDESDIPIKNKRNAPRDLFFTKHGSFNPEHFPMIEAIPGLSLDRSEARDDRHLWVTQFMCIDGDYLFEDTLITKTIAEYMPAINAENSKLKQYEKQRVEQLKPKVAEALKALRRLVNAALELDISKPSPYLVILSMDGDYMGKTLGTLDKGQHQTFSATLADFARMDVPRIVEQEHLGRVVYAGGDDVLALLPVQGALQVGEALRSAFEDTVAQIGINNHEGAPVTASTGLAYVHHTHNLQDAVHAANNAQKRAKDRFGRNAIGVEFLRRSGEPRSMGHKWQALHDPTIEHVSEITDAFSDGLSRNLPYDLAQITYSMANVNVPYDARHAEIRRIIKRRLPEGKRGNAEHLAERVLALAALKSRKLHDQWRNAQHWLELARFIAQGE